MTEIHRSRPSGESPSESPKGPAQASLVQQASRGKTLSREQRRFNRLVTRVAQLEQEIAKGLEKLERLLAGFHEKVAPLEESLAKREIELAFALAAAGERFALRGIGRIRAHRKHRPYTFAVRTSPSLRMMVPSPPA